jgi:hypothetical protein
MNASADGTKGKTMNTFFNDLRTAVRKRAAYNRTVAELQAMPLDVALDLDLYPGDAKSIARRAVYGN